VDTNREYFLTRSGGRTHRFTVTGIPDAIPISSPWKVRLGETPSFDLAQLQSWTDLAQGKGYSGWATYETTFQMNDLGPGTEWTLDLGAVHETADAELNGVALGAAWKNPRVLSCKTALRRGPNTLRIAVANLWIHKIVNSPPWDRKLVAETYGARWGEPDVAVPREMPPSGLLGPVRLVPHKRWSVSV
jgi:hypothetical protein